MEKTYEQMLALAKETFGENATVSWDNDREDWSINTSVGAPFNLDDYVDTAFYRAFVENGAVKWDQWERWAWKNYASGPLYRQVEQYNERMKREKEEYAARCLIFHSVRGDDETYKIITDFDEVRQWCAENGLDLEKARGMRDTLHSGGTTMADFEQRLIDNQADKAKNQK